MFQKILLPARGGSPKPSTRRIKTERFRDGWKPQLIDRQNVVKIA